MPHGKRYRSDVEGRDLKKVYSLPDAIGEVKKFRKTKFDQSVELCVHLGIEPDQADQAIRSSMSLPHGIGKTKRVIAFCSADKIEGCKQAGAIEAGGDELIKKVEAGWMDFDVAIASPDMMRVVSKLGRVLGPKGLMPSPKSGTVTADVVTAVKEYSAGKLEFRNDKGGNVQVVVGKMSFDANKLVDNAQAFLDTINRMKPASTKGQYIKRITLSGTMTPGVQVAIN